MRFIFAFVLLFLAGTFSGCVSIPVEPVSLEIAESELSAHVEFLSQRQLKGRKARSWESNTVRKYLVGQFESYGLSPWSQCEDFEQSFGLGTNIVGVLPGSELSDEIIILSAHYDHIGKTKKGICPGAGDNASGVAAILEIAEKLSQSDKPLKRTVCFALFDTEEMGMVGSMIFSLRDDFNDANVVAAVTVDMLGRELFDVVTGSLCLVGAEKYPQLRKSAKQTATDNDLKLLPLGSDLVGPRGDHAAFADNGMSLFFTCGLFSDYHKPTDTADNLDYEKMTRSTETICDTVVALANTEKLETPQDIAGSYQEELLALNYILDKVHLRYEEAQLTKEQNEKVFAVAQTTRKMLTDGDFSGKGRRKFVGEVLTALLPMLSLSDESMEKNDKHYLWIYEVCIPYMDILIAEYKKTIAEAMDNKLGVWLGGKKFSFQAHVFDLDDMSLVVDEDGVHVLDMVLTKIEIDYNFGGLFKRRGFVNSDFSAYQFGCSGSKEDIVDYCLMLWGNEKNKLLKSFKETWPKVFKQIEGPGFDQTYKQRLDKRLASGGFTDKKQWILKLLDSDNSDLLIKVIDNSEEVERKKTTPKIAAIVRNRDLSPRARVSALMRISNKHGSEGLLAIADVIGDEMLYKADENCRCSREAYKLKDHPLLRKLDEDEDIDQAEKEKREKEKAKQKREFIERIRKRLKIKDDEFLIIGIEDIAIGDAAHQQLKTLTGQNFKKNKDAWKKWIKENPAPIVEDEADECPGKP